MILADQQRFLLRNTTERHSPHSIEFSGGVCRRLSKAARGEDLEIEEPVLCGHFPSFHFHATLPRMHSAALVWHQVVQVRQPREKRLLAPPWMVEAFHHEQFPVNGVMDLIQQRAGHRHSGVFEHSVPARFLLLEPLSHALAIGCSSCDRDVIRKATWLLLDSRVVDKTMSYNPICAPCILLEALIFQEPYKCVACFRRPCEYKTLKPNKSHRLRV